MRFTPLLSFAGTTWMMWVWARRLAPAHAEHYFWACLAIYLASPLMNAMSSLAYPDQILILMTVVALHFLCTFLADWQAASRNRIGNLYLGAVFLGLAGLTKYNAALLGFGLVAVIVINPRLRSLLRSPHLYAAGMLTLLIVSPVFLWNAANGFPTLKLHAVQRFQGRGSSFQINGAVRVLGLSALYLSPLLLWAWGRFLLTRSLTGVLAQLQALGRVIFVMSIGLLVALASWKAAASQVAPHWNVIAILPFMLAAPLFLRSRWLFGIHLALGIAVSSVALVYYLSAPLLTDALGMSDREARITWGQVEVADAARAAKKKYGADFYATASYEGASKFAFGLGTDDDVLTFTDLIDQYDFWRDPNDYAGKSAIVVVEQGREKNLERSFASREFIETVQPLRFGRPMVAYDLYLARGYKPSPMRP